MELSDNYTNKTSKTQLNKMVNLLIGLFEDNYNFYIGATNNPNRRYEEHIQENKYKNIHHMVVLGNFNTVERTQFYEKYLIDKYGNHLNNIKKVLGYSNGQMGGGEGYDENTTKIYLLFMNK